MVNLFYNLSFNLPGNQFSVIRTTKKRPILRTDRVFVAEHRVRS